nr:unnamed protein product [Spirometra erinaceieuropaei]
MACKSGEIKGYAGRNEIKNFFASIKTIYGRTIKSTVPLRSPDGTTLLTKSQILKRWVEHFKSTLNGSSAVSDAASGRLLQVETNDDLYLPPSLPETIRAVRQLSSRKTQGADAIPTDVYRHNSPPATASAELFPEVWCQGSVPQNVKDATIVHLYTRKEDGQLCDNLRTISFLNIA